MAFKSCCDLSNNNETEWKSLQRYSCDDSLLRYTPPLIPQKLTKREPISVNTYIDHDGGESVTDSFITNGQPVCRVCFEYGAEPLYSPCKCDGSAKYIHEKCMLTWFHKTRRKSCEICLSKINIKSTGCKPLVKVCFQRNLIESLGGRESRNCVNMCENLQLEPAICLHKLNT